MSVPEHYGKPENISGPKGAAFTDLRSHILRNAQAPHGCGSSLPGKRADTMSGAYTYYDDGFFGFGKPGAFRAFSLMHIIPVFLCIALIVWTWYRRAWFRQWKYEGTFRYFLSFSMFLMEFGFFVWLLYVGDTSGQYLMMAKLPLHLCDIGLISCMFMVTSRNQTLFSFNFFVTLFGAVLACIIPQTVLSDVDPSHYRYYQYFGEHLIPIYCTVYMMIVHDMKPRYRDLWISVAGIALMLVPAFKLNESFPVPTICS